MHEANPNSDPGDEPGLRRYRQAIGRYPSLTAAEESALLRSINGGARELLDPLINAHLRSVASIAEEYLDQGLGYRDLIAEGTMGLISAATRFDETRSSTFTHYAEGQIRRRLVKAISELDGSTSWESARG